MEIKGKAFLMGSRPSRGVCIVQKHPGFLCLISNRLFLEEPTLLSTQKPKNTVFESTALHWQVKNKEDIWSAAENLTLSF